MMGIGAGNRSLIRLHHLIFGTGFQAKKELATFILLFANIFESGLKK
jgi:hypothetical protein